MKCGNAACERCSRAVRAAHCLDITLFFAVSVSGNIHMSYASGHTGIKHLYKIVDLFFLIHDSLLKVRFLLIPKEEAVKWFKLEITC